MRAKSVDSPHRACHPEDKVGDAPTVGMDFCFMGQKLHPNLMPILAVKEDKYEEVNVHALENKGV